MRGHDQRPEDLFSYIRLEQRIPADHPLRPHPREMVDTVLRELSLEFARLYAKTGRPSIPPEKLLRALLIQVLYSVPERAATDGAAELQPALPLVRGAEPG
jgi:transposase